MIGILYFYNKIDKHRLVLVLIIIFLSNIWKQYQIDTSNSIKKQETSRQPIQKEQFADELPKNEETKEETKKESKKEPKKEDGPPAINLDSEALQIIASVYNKNNLKVDNMTVQNGKIIKGAELTDFGKSENDMGLYSNIKGEFIRFVNNGGSFVWYSDGKYGNKEIMRLDKDGNLSITGNLTINGNVLIKGDTAMDKSVKIGDYQIQQDKENRLNFGRKIDNKDVPMVVFPKDESEPVQFRSTGMYYTNKRWKGNRHQIDNSDYNKYVYNVFKQAGYKENPIYMGGTDWSHSGQHMTLATVRNFAGTANGGNSGDKQKYITTQVLFHGERAYCGTDCATGNKKNPYDWNKAELKD
jgi:hypothetical protein